MGIRVVARVRPQQNSELQQDVIVSTVDNSSAPLVKIPNPKNENETYVFQFSGVYDQGATQQEIFDHEISPTIKHLFNGFDTTIFAYGSTGTGKTHTMRGGKTLADRGVIPRLLSGIYRRARKVMKDSEGATRVDISLSYYEIYKEKVFDLFETPDRRSNAGLPLRDNGGKTVVVGLTERPCESLKEFERLYDAANVNRSTSATKLNAASSRSHAILSIVLRATSGDHVRTSMASAIDLAGSEDNRRTENGKERMVESASINKSLFTLAKCAEAMSRGDDRIPYRESKMCRILSLGQNGGLTIMILNLAPVRSYHLGTLSSLHFAHRTKRIEVRELENEPVFKGCPRALPAFTGTIGQRQPLRPLTSTVHNASIPGPHATTKKMIPQPKAFAVYSDHGRISIAATRATQSNIAGRSSPLKRPSDPFTSSTSRPAKRRTPYSIPAKLQPTISQQAIEAIIERKVTDILAARVLDQPSIAPQSEISDEVQQRLDMLEKRIEGKDDGREQGLTFLLMAKQHAVRGEDASALRMYKLAKDFFPGNEKLKLKIEKIENKIEMEKKAEDQRPDSGGLASLSTGRWRKDSNKEDYQDLPEHGESQQGSVNPGKDTKGKRLPISYPEGNTSEPSPRSRQLIDIVNSHDVRQIRRLKGIGAKKAEAIVDALVAGDEYGEGRITRVSCLQDLSRLKGVGPRAVENMRAGLA